MESSLRSTILVRLLEKRNVEFISKWVKKSAIGLLTLTFEYQLFPIQEAHLFQSFLVHPSKIDFTALDPTGGTRKNLGLRNFV